MGPFIITGISYISKFAGIELAKYLLKKEGFDKIFSESTLATELNRTINETIVEYEKLHTVKNENGLYPFYQSQIIVTELLKFRVMHETDYEIQNLYDALQKEERIIQPTKDEINSFYEIFIEKINNDSNLKKIEIKNTFQDEIFLISKKFDSLQRNLERLINNTSADLELQWKDRIDAYKVSINQFKPETALRLLIALEDSFLGSEKKPTNEFLSIIEYQKGICYNFLSKEAESNKSYISAYIKNQTNKTFKEQATFSYYKLKEWQKSLELSDEILKTDEFNSFAHATILLNTDLNSFKVAYEQIPQIIKEDMLFKRLVYNSLGKEERYKEIGILANLSFIPKLSEYKNLKTSLDTYPEIVFWINIAINEFFKNYYFNFLESNKANLDIIKHLNNILTEMLLVIKHSEIEKDNYTLYFILSYTNFILTGERKFAYEMYEYYEKGKFKNFTFSLLCANTLQIAGYDSEALQLLNTIPENNNETALFLKQFIYLKQKDIENFILTSKECFNAVSFIDEKNITNYLNSLVTIYSTDKTDTLTVDDLIKGKTFSSENYKEYVTVIANLLIDGKNEGLIKRLDSVSKILADDNVINFAAITFYFMLEYEIAINLFNGCLDFEKESNELYYYINCLENIKTHNVELLILLEKWRTKFSFSDYLLRLEADKRRQLLDWNKCIEICTFYLDKRPNTESFIVLLIESYNQINDSASQLAIKDSLEKTTSFDYKHLPHVYIVSEILIRQKYFKEALDLLYRYAKNPENSQLRMSYFLACSKVFSKENPIAKEFEIVEEGHFIKYLLDKKIHFVEIGSNKPNFNDLIGHSKFEVVPIMRPRVNIKDDITILRIMNKYLSLHDEILEEVHNNPHSAIPMQSIEFEGSDLESMNKTFSKLFGEQGSKIEQENLSTISNYYNYSLSFTEVIMRLFRNEYTGGYYHLVHQNEGINTLPLIVYNTLDISNKQFILDYSSLLVLHQISRSYNLTYPNKFIISTFIVEDIKSQLQNLETTPESEMSLSITKEKVIPIFKHEGITENNKAFLNNLLDWIKNNCIVTVSPRILDFTSKLDNSKVSEKPFYDYVVNNLLSALEEDKILITDDTIYIKSKFLPINKTCSTEYYFNAFFGNTHEAFYEFIRNRYRGITLTSDILISEFEKKNTSQLNFYSNCLENLSPFRNPNNGVAAIQFIKSIILNKNLPEAIKQKEIIEVFFNLLRGWINDNIKSEIRALLIVECKLTNVEPDFLLRCFDDAVDLLDKPR